MVDLFNSLYKIAIIVLIVVIILAVLGGGGIFYYVKVRRKRHKTEDNINYSSFNRSDTKDYINVDIFNDMVKVDNGSRYIAVLDCQGFDFYSAHPFEQGNTVQNYIGFINTINKAITYRQYSKSVDLEDIISKYTDKLEKMSIKVNESNQKITEIETILQKEPNMIENRKKLYVKELEKTKSELLAYEFRKIHLEDQIKYIKNNSGVAITPLITSTYVVDWIYSPMEFPRDLTDEEIISRAMVELESECNAKIHALSAAGVKAKRCNTIELIDMFRRQSRPISAERYKIRDVLGSSYFEDIVSSDSIDRINAYVKETLDKEAFDSLEKAFANNSVENNTENIFINAGIKGEE